ncbi:MAG: hypothetical protein U1F61_08380 [Opitutaceae bacterium]
MHARHAAPQASPPMEVGSSTPRDEALRRGIGGAEGGPGARRGLGEATSTGGGGALTPRDGAWRGGVGPAGGDRP